MLYKTSSFTHKNSSLQKAAMFGLDARIALAIFGALSVITGAALYSAIQKSKTVALITTTNELIKAYEAYYVDTGFQPPIDPADINNSKIDTAEFFSSSAIGWKGPYLTYQLDSGGPWDGFPKLPQYSYFNYLEAPYKNWTSSAPCSTDNTVPCSAWIIIRSIPISIAKDLDIAIDGSTSIDSGKVRHKTVGSDEHVFIYIMDVK